MVKSLVKTAVKSKRGRKKIRGRPSKKVKELMESRDISRAEAEKLAKKEAGKKPVKKKAAEKKSEPKRTRSEQRELDKLIRQQ